jgi:hypothetical protein
MLVSISILDARLRLVRVSVEHARRRMFEFVRALWFRNESCESFLNLTANDVELSLFADAALVDRIFGSTEDAGEFEISQETWFALQLDVTDDWGQLSISSLCVSALIWTFSQRIRVSG